jgi:hypothetical protein
MRVPAPTLSPYHGPAPANAMSEGAYPSQSRTLTDWPRAAKTHLYAKSRIDKGSCLPHPILSR